MLSACFDHLSLRAFVRELHRHGFRKRALARGQFFHKRFRRDSRPHTLSQIKCRSPPSSQQERMDDQEKEAWPSRPMDGQEQPQAEKRSHKKQDGGGAHAAANRPLPPSHGAVGPHPRDSTGVALLGAHLAATKRERAPDLWGGDPTPDLAAHEAVGWGKERVGLGGETALRAALPGVSLSSKPLEHERAQWDKVGN